MERLHGEPLDLAALDRARTELIQRSQDLPLAFTATAVLSDTHRFAYLFPHLQLDAANLLPESPATQAALIALGQAMQGEGADSDIPAAYTYFGQFVDHDITLEAVSGNVDLNGPVTPKSLAEIEATIVNTRTSTLDLDSVYALPAPRDPANAAMMLLGRVSAFGGRPPGKGDDNDLPRRPRDPVAESDRAALTGDPRNDENLIVAQLHVAFLKAHNAIVRQGLTFEQAQVVLRQHYQHIVIEDFLKRIADPAIVDDIVMHGPKAYNPDPTRTFMPLEFSVAAFRLGHSMIRSSYNFNLNFRPASLGLLFTFTALSGQIGGFDTLPENWIIEWENFIDAGRPFARAHALDTLLVEPLAELTSTTGAPLPGRMASLAVRNLLRGYLLRLPTGQAVAAALGFTPLTAAQLAAAAANDQQRQVLAANGFGERTPLWYYILAEAAHGGGKRLGPVGSTIVADVLVGLVRRSDDSVLNQPNWSPTLPSRVPGRFDLSDLLRLAGVLGSPVSQPPGGAGTYVVQPGDTLSGIAQARLGDASRWPEIFALNRNQISDPDLIFPGQVLTLPAAGSPVPLRTYTVQPGDTLSGIAQDRLGDASRWPEIFALNRNQISDPDLIFPGQVLTLPN